MLTKEQDEAIKGLQTHVLEAAGKIVRGERNTVYGEPEDNFHRIALFWQAYFENTGRSGARVNATDVSALMRLMKEARLCNTPDHLDSFIDLIGYTLTGLRVVETRKAIEATASLLEEKSFPHSAPVLGTSTLHSGQSSKPSKPEDRTTSD